MQPGKEFQWGETVFLFNWHNGLNRPRGRTAHTQHFFVFRENNPDRSRAPPVQCWAVPPSHRWAEVGPGTTSQEPFSSSARLVVAIPGLCFSSECRKRDSECCFPLISLSVEDCAQIRFLSIFSPLEQSCHCQTEVETKCWQPPWQVVIAAEEKLHPDNLRTKESAFC